MTRRRGGDGLAIGGVRIRLDEMAKDAAQLVLVHGPSGRYRVAPQAAHENERTWNVVRVGGISGKHRVYESRADRRRFEADHPERLHSRRCDEIIMFAEQCEAISTVQ